jgi:hypothetical protein
MKTLFLLPFLLFSCFVSAEIDQGLIMNPFQVISDSENKDLAPNKSKFSFQIYNQEFQNPSFKYVIKSAINGVWRDVTPDEFGRFNFEVEPGTYSFQFYVNDNFYEIKSREVEILKRHETTIRLTFAENWPNPERITVDKPVIYFHSKEVKLFDLSVVPAGQFTFVYPEMTDSWKGTVQPNGDISVNGDNYPYLFWESNQTYQFRSEGNGFHVEKADVVSFLEKKISELGLSKREQADFITYWGPKMVANGDSFVQFSVDDSCDKFATMNCSPKPESVRRVYIQVTKWDPFFESYLKDVTFAPIPASDWFITEWGGFSFTIENVSLYEN